MSDIIRIVMVVAGLACAFIGLFIIGKKPERLLYHYHATYQEKQEGCWQTTSIDGLIIPNPQIDSMESYREMKKAIATNENLVITSLTPLRMVSSDHDLGGDVEEGEPTESEEAPGAGQEGGEG